MLIHTSGLLYPLGWALGATYQPRFPLGPGEALNFRQWDSSPQVQWRPFTPSGVNFPSFLQYWVSLDLLVYTLGL